MPRSERRMSVDWEKIAKALAKKYAQCSQSCPTDMNWEYSDDMVGYCHEHCNDNINGECYILYIKKYAPDSPSEPK
jgi:hypothetical protein